MSGSYVANGNEKDGYGILMEKPETKRPLGISRHRWVNNIKMDVREIGWGDVDWIDLAEDWDKWRAVLNSLKFLKLSDLTFLLSK
jgi:hypothetical protein